jgi:hypothetical protein
VTVTWTFKAAKDGNYAVKAAAATTKPSAFTVSGGGAKLDARVGSTGDYKMFKEFDLGTLALKAGPQEIKIAPVAGQWTPVNLRALTLTPVP